MNKVLCPKCNSENVMAQMFVTASATVDINESRVDEVHDADFKSPADVDEVYCLNCEHEWRIKAVVINGMYEYKAI
jgi:hypothetical protein